MRGAIGVLPDDGVQAQLVVGPGARPLRTVRRWPVQERRGPRWLLQELLLLMRMVVGCRGGESQVPQTARIHAHPRVPAEDGGGRMRVHAGQDALQQVSVVHGGVVRGRWRMRRRPVRVDGRGGQQVGGVVRAGRQAGGVG